MSAAAESSVADAAPPVPDNAKTLAPETQNAIWTRRAIIISFWVVIVALGLPHWIWTTSIPRSPLPLESMNKWADGKACQLHYPIDIDFKSSATDAAGVSLLASEVSTLLNQQNESPLYTFRVRESNGSAAAGSLSGFGAEHGALQVSIEEDATVEGAQASLRSWIPVLDVRHNPHQSVDIVTLAPLIADEIREIFAGEQRAISYLLDGTPIEHRDLASLSPQHRLELDARNTRVFKYASTYHLTFSLFTASASPSQWDIEDAIQKYLTPLLERLSHISHLTVDTQVQLYASFSPSISGPLYDALHGQYILQSSDLSGFINAAEWPLSPGIGAGPTINFVLYIPSPEHTPLTLADTGGSSWIIPQWGGVQILNPSNKQREQLTTDDLRPVMLTFADQLTALLGVPSSPSSLSLRISSLTRERTTALILSASSTLGALARLTLKLTSIAIPDVVAKNVNETIHRLEQSCADLREGRFHSALENARIAETEAEQAFFEPSMVGQVYFPDEHKVAVYVPLLGPMAVPLVMAGLKELRRLREKKAKTA